MNRTLLLLASLAAALAALGGCATVDPRADYDRTEQLVESAVGAAPDFAAEDAERDAAVADLLAGGLTADEAVRLALLNDPQLRAELARVGIGHADVIQSGLYSNPSLDFLIRWPDGGGLTNLQFGVAQNLAELWQLPLRKKTALREQERIIFDVARLVSSAALDARAAYYRALQRDRERELTVENVAITKQLLELAVARRDAGAVSDVDVNLARTQHYEAEIRRRNAALAAIEARSDLARLLGLTLPPHELPLADTLQPPAQWDLSAEQIIAAARANRLDLRAVEMTVAAAAARVAFERTRFLRSVEVGISLERAERPSRSGRDWLAETGWNSLQAGTLTPPSLQPRERQTTDWVLGPSLALELPLFDQNQAQIARAELEHQQAVLLREALDRRLTQDAWLALQRSRTADENARFYHDQYLPLQEKSLDLAREAYTAGTTTLLTVLDAQRGLLAARAGYAEALADAAVAATELQRVSGLTRAALLDATAPSPSSPSSESPR